MHITLIQCNGLESNEKFFEKNYQKTVFFQKKFFEKTILTKKNFQKFSEVRVKNNEFCI